MDRLPVLWRGTMTRITCILLSVVALSGCVESLPMQAKLLAAHQDCTTSTEVVADNACVENVLKIMEVQERAYERRVNVALGDFGNALEASTNSYRSSVGY